MHRPLKSLTAIAAAASCAAATYAAPAADLPGDLKSGELLYESSMTNAESVEGWRMEGPGEVAFKDGWMHMQSPKEKMHHVFWCPKRFPASFVAQWEAQNLETDAGLCIVFFAAAANKDDGSIFNDDLPKRDGDFKQYTQGAIRCYHASYYANAAHNPDRKQTNLRKNPGFHLVAEGPEGIPTKSEKIHTITLAKHGPNIRLWVDDKKVLDWTDKGKKGGAPHGDGFIGLRQMQWTHFRYRNFRVWKTAEASASAAAPGSVPAAAPAAGPAARAYADAMLEHGKDRWGKTSSPLFTSMLTRDGYKLLTEDDAPDLSEFNIRDHDRAYGSSNVAHDEELYHLLYALTEETGDDKYAEAADAALQWFMKNCRSDKTGLLAWGEHLSWNLKEDRVNFPKLNGRPIPFFELYGGWGLWSRLFELAPEAAADFAEGMWDHAVTDHKKILFSRHVRFHKGAYETGKEFPRYYGHFPLIWAHAMHRTDDKELKQKLTDATERVLDAALARRHPETGAIPSGMNKRNNMHKTYWLTNNLLMASELHKAVPMLPDDLAAKARELMNSADEVILKLDHEVGPDGRGFVSRTHLDTLEPGDARQGRDKWAHTTLWKAGYGMPLTSGVANQMLQRYHQSDDERYAKLATAAAKLYLDATPDPDLTVHPKVMAEAINLMVTVYDMTTDEAYLKRAEYFASLSRKLFLDSPSALPRVLSKKHDHYESITGGPALMLSLHKLAQALK